MAEVDIDELEREGHEWDHGQLLRAARQMAGRIRTLEAELAEARGTLSPLHWISADERLPEHEVFVAVLYPKQGTLVPAVARLTPICWKTPQMIAVDARYWAPLPEKGPVDET
jgi:hypothetical protein